MTKTSRRSALRLMAAGSAVTVLSAQNDHNHGGNGNGHGDNTIISFGQWLTDPPVDRFQKTPPASANNHMLNPNQVTIKVGGSVCFMVAGFHNVTVYDDGTQPGDIDTTRLIGSIIDDPTNRIYRGLDPASQPQDRVEVVNFSRPGTFLVICGVLPHFNAGMYGFVTVVGDNGNNN